jgi:hypothetical protein
MKMKKMGLIGSIGFIVFTLISSFLFVGLAHASDWVWQNPLSRGHDLAGVWGSSGSDVFAAGDSGTILHYNGSSWSAMSSGTTNYLYGVWGSSGSGVFAVGWDGTVLHHGPMSGIADFDGDGKPDILWRNTSTGANAVWYMDGVTLIDIADLPALPNTDYALVGP